MRRTAVGLTALCIVAGCATVSYRVRPTAVACDGSALVCRATVEQVLDYHVDIACGSVRTEPVAAFGLRYARADDGSLATRPTRLAASPAALPWPRPDPGVAPPFDAAAALGANPDEAWCRVVHNAEQFTAALSADGTMPGGVPYRYAVNADRQYVVVLGGDAPFGTTFTFAGQRYRCEDAFVVFGRTVPDGRAFTAKRFGMDGPGYPPRLGGVDSTDGTLEVWYWDRGAACVVAPLAGWQTRLRGSFDGDMLWDVRRHHLVIPLRDDRDGRLAVVDWDYRGGRWVRWEADVAAAFVADERGGLVPDSSLSADRR